MASIKLNSQEIVSYKSSTSKHLLSSSVVFDPVLLKMLHPVIDYTYNSVNYRVHVFKSSGTFYTPVEVQNCDVIVQAGGGAGGHSVNGDGGSGGGAGGMIVRTNFTLPAGSYEVTVGAGGFQPCNSTDLTAGAGGNTSDKQFTEGGATFMIGNPGTAYPYAQGEDSYFGYVDGTLSNAYELKAFGGGSGGCYGFGNPVDVALGNNQLTPEVYQGGRAGGCGGGGGGHSGYQGGASTQTSHNGGTGYGNAGCQTDTTSGNGAIGGGGGIGGEGGYSDDWDDDDSETFDSYVPRLSGGVGKKNFLVDVDTTITMLRACNLGHHGHLGGGGASCYSNGSPGRGGVGGGGHANSNSAGPNENNMGPGYDGMPNTGGGGGGSGRVGGQDNTDYFPLRDRGGAGGSGLVLVRYIRT